MSTRADSLVRAASRHPVQDICLSVISTDGAEELMLTINGALDLRLAPPLWELSDCERPAYTSYLIDLTGVDKVFGSGLACLIMFVGRIQDRGGRVRVLTESGDLARRWTQLLSAHDLRSAADEAER